ncbi:phage head closure protein [Sutcliffiella halmapala]
MATFDDELTLIDITFGENALGDPIKVEKRKDILCDAQSIQRTEFYAAAAHGLKPEYTFIVNKYDYQRQSEVEFDGVRYRVIRSYQPKSYKGIEDFDSLELVCEGMINNASS